MTTRTLTVTLKDLIGVAQEGVALTVSQENDDQTSAETVVISSSTATTNASGEATFSLVPNTLGSQSTTYRIVGKLNTLEILNVTFQMPDADSDLHDLVATAAAPSARSPYLDANQIWTGSNTFTGSVDLSGASITIDSADVDHDSTTGYVADEHIPHSSVQIIAGDGLTGGGNLASSRTLNIGAGTGVTVNADSIEIGQDVSTTADVTFADVIVSGNLTVMGATTTVNSTTVTIDDPIFTLGGDTAPGSDDNKDRGIEFRWHDGVSAKRGFFGYDDSAETFTFIPDASNTGEVFSGSPGNVAFGSGTFTDIEASGGSATVALLGQAQTFTANQSFSSTVNINDDVQLQIGSGADYYFKYSPSLTRFELRSVTAGVVALMEDGTNDLRFQGGLSTDGEDAPTQGLTVGNNTGIRARNSADSATVTMLYTDTSDDVRVGNTGGADLYLDATSRVYIDSTLRIGGGGTTTAQGSGDTLVLDEGAADTGLSIMGSNSTNIYFGDAANNRAGRILYLHTDDSLNFYTNGNSIRQKINSSGGVQFQTGISTENLTPPSDGILVGDGAQIRFGDDADFWHTYLDGSQFFALRSANVDGASSIGSIMLVANGTDDVRFQGGISTDGETAPTSGMVIGNDNSYTARNVADTANVSLIKLTSSDVVQIGNGDLSVKVPLDPASSFSLTRPDLSVNDWAFAVQGTGALRITGSAGAGTTLTFTAGGATVLGADQAVGQPEEKLVLPNNENIAWYNAATDGQVIALNVDADDNVRLGNTSSDVIIRSSNVEVTNSGLVVGNSLTSLATNNGVDIQSGGIALAFGADASANTRTDATTKTGTIAAAHYTNAQDPIAVAQIDSRSSFTALRFGGESGGTLNSPTLLQFYVSPTTTGSQQLVASIDDSTMVLGGIDIRLDNNKRVIGSTTGGTRYGIATIDNNDDAVLGNINLDTYIDGSQVYIDNSGLVVGNNLTSAATNNGVDIQSGGIGLVVGADGSLNSRTNATAKIMRMGLAHYQNAEEPMAMLHGNISSSVALLDLGGGTTLLNASTDIRMFTASNTTTVSGTQRVNIDDTNFDISTLDLRLDNNKDIDWFDSGGVARTVMRLNSSDLLQIGNTVNAATIYAGSTGLTLTSDPTDLVGFHGTTPVAQQATTGTTTGFTAGTGTGVNDDSTFTGGSGTAAYTVGDIVLALKNYGLLAAS